MLNREVIQLVKTHWNSSRLAMTGSLAARRMKNNDKR
jgi:hypothetical protein